MFSKNLILTLLKKTLTSLSVDEETNSCTITSPSKTILLTFSWAPYK